ncbi:MAG TPA: RHS repeat-associated core domain-containing protein, partial [Candidatus Acidoferrales bacterium]|nr:RHS repeat-associated core domain-containing protein [Candidatus Acidoferrales bacterium]
MVCPTNSVTIEATTNRITGSPYSYDLNGNMANDGLNALTYDGENRMVSAAGGAYTYDGNSLRVKKVSGGTTTLYLFSGTKVIAEYVNGAAPTSPTREYIYSGSAMLAKIEGGATQYYQADHLSPRVTTDSSGGVLGQQGHYPYGESWYAQSTTTKWLFASYERDSESGNDYAVQRYYANRLGRFMIPDPLMGAASEPQSLNRYSYVADDPINRVDPRGASPLFPVWPFGDCKHHPRWGDDTEFLAGLFNICPFLPWLPFIRELRELAWFIHQKRKCALECGVSGRGKAGQGLKGLISVAAAFRKRIERFFG